MMISQKLKNQGTPLRALFYLCVVYLVPLFGDILFESFKLSRYSKCQKHLRIIYLHPVHT